jgi:hypothetical protein
MFGWFVLLINVIFLGGLCYQTECAIQNGTMAQIGLLVLKQAVWALYRYEAWR